MNQLPHPSEGKNVLFRFAVFIFLAVFFSFALFFHFGPLGIKAGDDLVLASAKLSDASRVFIMAHRTGHLIDAYEVTLYRVSPTNGITINWLGYEDGYWWRCGLSYGNNSNILEIHAFGGLMAEYDITSGDIKWHDKQDVLHSYHIGDLSNVRPIPNVILLENNLHTNARPATVGSNATQ